MTEKPPDDIEARRLWLEERRRVQYAARQAERATQLRVALAGCVTVEERLRAMVAKWRRASEDSLDWLYQDGIDDCADDLDRLLAAGAVPGPEPLIAQLRALCRYHWEGEPMTDGHVLVSEHVDEVLDAVEHAVLGAFPNDATAADDAPRKE